MSINRLYDTWIQTVKQLLPGERVTRVRNLTWLIVGVFLSRSVRLDRVALKIPGPAKETSLTRRLSRFLSNPAISARPIYEPIARCWLRYLAESQKGLTLIIDGTRVGFGYHMLLVAVAYRRRALPIAWVWIRAKTGHSPLQAQLALLEYVHSLLPQAIPIILVGDSEFRALELFFQLERWGWKYVLRMIETYQVRWTDEEPWQNVGALVSAPGSQAWCPGILLTLKHAYRTNVLAYWQAGEKQAWLLATNVEQAQPTLQAYRRRMWVEEMFGDWKGHGFDFQKTHLRDPDRLSRLTLAVILLYLWLIFGGLRVIKNGHRHYIDRHDRRDFSLSQIGLRWFERCVKNDTAFTVSLTLPAWILSGS
jgi:hypothetical protein